MNILIHRNGEQYGPYGLEEVRGHLRDGAISADDLAWSDGMPDWRPLREILPSDEPRVTAIPLPVAGSPAAVVTAARPSLGSAASVNPYQAPSTALAAAQVTPNELIPAGQGQRFLTYIIDYIAVMIMGFCLGVVVVLLMGDEGANALQEIPDMVLGLGLFLVYYVLLEGIFGRTLGKLITGTKVVNEDGDKASFGQVLGRTLCRFIPFEPFSVLGREGRGWHDSIPKTLVIKAR
jgi:uncharacterized RDD family membrane protein YckC